MAAPVVWGEAKLSRLWFQSASTALPWSEGVVWVERVGGTERGATTDRRDGTETVPCGTTRLVLPHNNI